MPKNKTSAPEEKHDFEKLNLLEFVDQKTDKSFTAEDFSILNTNEHMRYAPSSRHIAHAVIGRNEKGEKVAWQYHIPATENPNDPVIYQLKDIEEFKTKFGHVRFKGVGSNGKGFYATRYEHAKVKLDEDDDAESVDIAYFSEEESPGKQPFWGSLKPVPRFRTDLSKEEQEDLAIEQAEVGKYIKVGEIIVDTDSVRHRETNSKRTPDQNTVMGGSARDAYEEFYQAYQDEISPELGAILKKAFSAPLRGSFESQRRPEWLHASGFSLMHKDHNPRHKGNLGAAGKWANTEMMVLERVAKWFALNQEPSDTTTKTDIKIKALFKMLSDSELIDHIKFEVDLESKGRMIHFIQELDTFQKFPVYRKASDLAQVTGIAYSMLHGKDLAKIEKVKGASIVKSITKAVATKQGLKPSGDLAMPKDHKLPTHVNLQNSIAQIFVTSHAPNYDAPWLGTTIDGCRGSGSVIQMGSEKFVLTNAHCVENYIRTQVRLANQYKKYIATPICISYQADLALLKVEDVKFQSLAQPVELGEMIGLRDEIEVYGFPKGGRELSITKGIVSRIEVQEVEISETDMLQIQVDAAINNGDSGGGAFSGGKLVGVPFQGYDFAQNLGYIIPMPIVTRFIKEAFSGKPYQGFPILPINIDILSNQVEKKFYGLQPEQTGIIVDGVSPLSDANEKIKRNDIILEIDGLVISDDGKVKIQEIGDRIDFKHIAHMKFIGDKVKLKLIRDKKELEVEVILDSVPYEKLLIGPYERDRMPTYYANSGFVFTRVSRTWIEGPGSDLQSVSIDDPEFGLCDIENIFKKDPKKELVAIAAVLDCDNTEGYDGLTHAIVTKVNEKDINNFQDLVDEMDKFKGEIFVIETSNKKKIPFTNFNAQQSKALLKQYKIPFDRSEDLRPGSPTPTLAQTIHPAPGPEPTKVSETLSVIAPSVTMEAESSEEETPVARKRKHKQTPGQRHFARYLEDLEDRAMADAAEEEVLDWEQLTENDEEEADYRPKRSRRSRVESDAEEAPKRSHSSFFKTKKEHSKVTPGWLSKPKKYDHEEDEDIVHNKRKRFG